jgi:hypothetical protein
MASNPRYARVVSIGQLPSSLLRNPIGHETATDCHEPLTLLTRKRHVTAPERHGSTDRRVRVVWPLHMKGETTPTNADEVRGVSDVHMTFNPTRISRALGGPVRRRIPSANGPTGARSAVIDRGGPVHRRTASPNRPTLPGTSGRRASATSSRPRSLPSVPTDHAGTLTTSELNARADASPKRSQQTRYAPRPAPHDGSLERSATRPAQTHERRPSRQQQSC